MSEFGDQLDAELDAQALADAMSRCRDLFTHFNGKSRGEMSFADQAQGIELILERCKPHADGDGDHELVIVTRLDADLLAGLALTAFRLRRMAPVEREIRETVMGK